MLTFFCVFYESMPDFPMDSNNGNCRGTGIGEYLSLKLYNKLYEHILLILNIRAVLIDA
mgnify:CR=1